MPYFVKANKLTLNMTKKEFMLRGSGQRLNTLTASPSCSHNGQYSDETGFNYEIIWCNNWRQTRFSYKKRTAEEWEIFFFTDECTECFSRLPNPRTM